MACAPASKAAGSPICLKKYLQPPPHPSSSRSVPIASFFFITRQGGENAINLPFVSAQAAFQLKKEPPKDKQTLELFRMEQS